MAKRRPSVNYAPKTSRGKPRKRKIAYVTKPSVVTDVNIFWEASLLIKFKLFLYFRVYLINIDVKIYKICMFPEWLQKKNDS
jgi:hypothetical protein